MTAPRHLDRVVCENLVHAQALAFRRSGELLLCERQPLANRDRTWTREQHRPRLRGSRGRARLFLAPRQFRAAELSVFT
jgi:hypothetical protein